jgi:hypothetical protein
VAAGAQAANKSARVKHTYRTLFFMVILLLNKSMVEFQILDLLREDTIICEGFNNPGNLLIQDPVI